MNRTRRASSRQAAARCWAAFAIRPTPPISRPSQLQAQNSKAEVVAFANAGQDTDNSIKQSGEFGLVKGGQKLVGLLMFDTDVHAIGLEAAQGTYLTTASYWNMDDKTRAWSKKFFERTKVMPTMIQTGVYGSVLHYLQAIKALPAPTIRPR